MEILWTKSALRNVKSIHTFYTKTASKDVANKIVEPLFKYVKSLEQLKTIGQEEDLLKILRKGHRYLVHKHIKIIYIMKEDKIFITHAFDTRRNPSKLK